MQSSDLYISSTQDQGKAFYQQFIGRGKVVMLNLLKFRDQADYADSPALAPAVSVTGREAYQAYMDHTVPLLEKAGSRVLYFGVGHTFLIGPAGEGWDAGILVEHESVERFMAFATDVEYLAGAGHRTAALQDSRLLPLSTATGL